MLHVTFSSFLDGFSDVSATLDKISIWILDVSYFLRNDYIDGYLYLSIR